MISNTGSNVLESNVDLFRRWDGTALEYRRWSEVVLGSEVALNHPINGALPLRVRCSEDLVKDVQINTEALDVVLHRSETKVDQVNDFSFDEDVVA